MANKLANRARMTVASAPGTGAATLSAAVSGFQTFAAAGIVGGDLVSYLIEDGSAWELGQGLYAATGPTLTRTSVLASSSGTSAITASASALVSIVPLAADLVTLPLGAVVQYPAGTFATASTSGTGTTATVTFAALGGQQPTFPIGSSVVISGVTPTGYNGTYVVTASAAGSVSYSSTATGSQTAAGTLYNAPTGYLRADGALYARSAYPQLAALVGAPLMPSLETISYTNASLLAGDVYAANGILFQTGTAAGSSAVIAAAMQTSADGITWTAQTAINPYGVYYNGSVYFAIGQSGNNWFAYSSNLTSATTAATWAVGFISGQTVYAATVGGTNTFCMITNNACTGNYGVYTSTNGSSWTGRTVTGFSNTSGGNVSIVSLGNGNPFLISSGAAVYRSTDGTTWTTLATSDFGGNNVVTLGAANGKYIAITAAGAVYTSTTGATGTWTNLGALTGAAPAVAPTYPAAPLVPIAWNGTMYVAPKTAVASGVPGAYVYSADLLNWASEISNFNPTAMLNSRFYGRGTGKTSVRWIDHNGYTSASQFPMPNLPSAQNTTAGATVSGNNNSLQPYWNSAAFIKAA